jgi:hypothetical protein
MQAINAGLSQADIGLAGLFPHIDTGDRRLRRVFNKARFQHGGRLSGGWWTNLPKAVRRDVTIEGESTMARSLSAWHMPASAPWHRPSTSICASPS